MKLSTHSNIGTLLKPSSRIQINPIKNLCPQTLTRLLEQFHQGNLAQTALVWEAIEQRDDVIKSVALKRKKAISRLPWQVLTLDDSPEALAHKQALEYFYNNLTATHALDTNQKGGFALLVRQMLDCLGKKYAVHEIVYEEHGHKKLTACFRFVPLWFFENTTGKLRFMPKASNNLGYTHFDSSKEPRSIELQEAGWLVSVGDCLMEPSSIAYLFKHLPLRDWLIYCERNGMPGIKAVTDFPPGSPQWHAAFDAVKDFGAEFNALMTRGTDIEAIDLTSRGELPYPKLIERMDRALITLWRGSDLSTFSKTNATGVSAQTQESAILETDDAAMISETLNAQVDRFVLKHCFGVKRGKAYVRLCPCNDHEKDTQLERYQKLAQLGVPLPLNHLQEYFGIPQPTEDEKIIKNN